MNHRKDLLTLFGMYCRHVGLSPARVSTLIFNHGARIRGIAEGNGFTIASYEHAVQWFSDHWPADLAWPADIDRPPFNPDSPAAKAMVKALVGVDLNAKHQPEPDSSGVLNERGEVANIEQFAREHILSVDIVRKTIAIYGKAKPKDGLVLRKGSQMSKALAALLDAGDCRFRQHPHPHGGPPAPAFTADFA